MAKAGKRKGLGLGPWLQRQDKRLTGLRAKKCKPQKAMQSDKRAEKNAQLTLRKAQKKAGTGKRANEHAGNLQ